MNKTSIYNGWCVCNSLCHYIFSQLPEPESISSSTVGIRNFPLLRCHHTHMLRTTDMHYPTRFQRNKFIKLSCLCSWIATGHTIRISWLYIFLVNTWHFMFRHKMQLRSTYLENRSFLAYSLHSSSRQNSLRFKIDI